eukprot:3075753-Prymnesium_polylepis.6
MVPVHHRVRTLYRSTAVQCSVQRPGTVKPKRGVNSKDKTGLLPGHACFSITSKSCAPAQKLFSSCAPRLPWSRVLTGILSPLCVFGGAAGLPRTRVHEALRSDPSAGESDKGHRR